MNLEQTLSSLSAIDIRTGPETIAPCDIFQGAHTHPDLLSELPPYLQDLGQSPDGYGCDDFLWSSKNSDIESDVSVLTPRDLSQGLLEASLYERESEPAYRLSETIDGKPLGDNLSWRDFSIWSILQGEWPRLD